MTAYKEGDPTTLNRLYGRSIGKPLRAHQQGLVDNLLPRIAVPDEGPVTAERLFGDSRPLHFEIGLIGAEPYVNGVAQCLAQIEEERLANIRLVHGDALQALARVPDGALTMVYLLHPDPWPKAKHAKRRMMNDGPVRMIADKLKPGGEFRFGTDHPIYLRHALMVMRRFTDEFEWQVEGRDSWENRPSGWCQTRYEKKAREQMGHEVWYFRFRRR